MRILVVDDNKDVVKLIEDALKLQGIKSIDKAYTYEEGLNKIKNENYSAYILDYHISSGNGLELAKMAKEKGEARIVIITCDTDFKTKEFKVFYKPFNVIELSKYIMSKD